MYISLMSTKSSTPQILLKNIIILYYGKETKNSIFLKIDI